MTLFTRHILLPAIAPLSIIGLYFTPVSLMGCANRGLVALAIVFLSLVAGIAAGVMGLQARGRNGTGAGWWIASTLILLLPALLVLGPLG